MCSRKWAVKRQALKTTFLRSQSYVKEENAVILNLGMIKRHFDLFRDKGDDRFHGQGSEVMIRD